MKTGRFLIFMFCFFVIGLCGAADPDVSSAETVVLKFAHPFPPTHPRHVGVLVPWAKRIEEQTQGRIKITFFPGGALGKPGQTYSVVEKGIADLGWDIADYSPGRFPLTTVIELPFMIRTAEKGSLAIWQIYEKFPDFQKEYGDTKLLMLSTHGPGVFATINKPIRSLADLQGLKIKTASSFTTDAMQLLGAVPVTQPVTETYTSLQRGVLDGIVNPFDSIVVFKLHELLKYYTPAEFYTMVFWAAMNKNKFNSLPGDLRKVIEENSGLSLSRTFGQSFDESYAGMKKVCLETGMQEIAFSNEETEELKALTAPLKDKWVQDMAAKGLPGKAILEAATAFASE